MNLLKFEHVLEAAYSSTLLQGVHQSDTLSSNIIARSQTSHTHSGRGWSSPPRVKQLVSPMLPRQLHSEGCVWCLYTCDVMTDGSRLAELQNYWQGLNMSHNCNMYWGPHRFMCFVVVSRTRETARVRPSDALVKVAPA